MTRRAFCVALVAATAAAGPAAAVELRMLMSWDKSNPAVSVMAEPFARNVEAASKGGIKLVLHGPETVPPFEQLQPVAAGAFQLLFTHGNYHYGQTGIGTALDAIGGTLEQRRASGLFEMVDRHYQKLGLKLIAAPISHKTGYAFQLKTPVTAEGDLKGKKIRGTPTYHPLIRMLGGAPVVMSIGETYTALEKGVIDGGSGPVVGLLSFKWHEVGKYVTQPSFGVQHELFLMNLAAFNRLSDAEKKILLDEGRKIEDVWYTEYDRMAEAEYAELVKRGTTITTFGPSQQKLNEVWNDGLWGMAEQKSPADAKELRALARAKGLSN